MTYPAYIREKAIEMRREKKLTIDELAERLAIPRTTIYYWVRDIPIAITEKQTLAAYRAGQASRRINRKRREAAYESGVEECEQLLAEPTFRDFICMYIGEGYKRNRNVVSVCNSDPAVVRLSAAWIRRFSSNPVRFSLQYHADQDLEELKAYWGDQLGIEPASITMQRKSNSSQLAGRTWRSKYGVLNVVAADTYLRARIQAWMDAIRSDWP